MEIHLKVDGPVTQEEAPEKSDEDNTTKLSVLCNVSTEQKEPSIQGDAELLIPPSSLAETR